MRRKFNSHGPNSLIWGQAKKLCLEAAVPVAVPDVGPIAAELVGLLVHDGVHDLLGEQPEQRLVSTIPSVDLGMAAFYSIASATISIAAPVLSQSLCLLLFRILGQGPFFLF